MHCIATLLFTELLVQQLRKAASEGENGRTRVVWTSSGMAQKGARRMESSSPLSVMAQEASGSTMDNRNSRPGSSAEGLREDMGEMEL
jgi:hypothetical protein